MLAAGYVGLRFIHFAALMLIFGSALFSAWLAPRNLRPVLIQRSLILQKSCLCVCVLSAALMYAWQGGMMGDGWNDIWRPVTWMAVVGTQTGTALAWQIIIALLTLVAALLQSQQQKRVLLLVTLQFVLAAGIGHAAMRDGMPGVVQRGNQLVHLLCAAFWLGGLLPLLLCQRLARGQWQTAALYTMMRFSLYGHFAVAGVLLTGVVNTLLIQGLMLPWHSAWGRLLLVKCALVALMVVIALVNRYVLVPRLSLKSATARRFFFYMTWAEMGLGALVLATVSLFATWEPF
ncbi:copper homeostasis membrane protein CopD [Vagococcus sp. WN89Y]|uniref:copper homeostasis membrane protein CopD n=1 Tax=Vagococcus sp. WN89Y TaxID=3457258 RepID=UPI003FCDC2B3